jgi:Zn-dependent peptidase ImmA (M78 family)/transcriptional regulator with XRE-family HTH domain
MIGARVRLAREACRLTQQQLAASTGVSQSTLSAIESGRITDPPQQAITKIASATQFPLSFFRLGPLPDLPEGNYRRRKRGASKVDKQIRAQVLHVVETVDRSESTLKLPVVVITPIRETPGPDDLETLATGMRGVLGLNNDTPIRNLIRAVERAGVVVVRLPAQAKQHDSFSAWPNYGLGGRPIIALSTGHPGDRDRFNVAHELAHLFLHTARPGVARDQAEIEANRFAGALLLPRRAAKDKLSGRSVTLRVLMDVKASYGLSMAATAIRARDLNLISNVQVESIFKQLSARKWRRNEPVVVLQEMPLMIAQVVEALGGEGQLKERAERLSMSCFTLRALESS